MKIEIKHRYTHLIIINGEYLSVKDCLEKTRGADLGGADLRGADLGGVYLGGVYLGGADLRGADLGGVYLGGADLRGADLGGADLRGVKSYQDSHDIFSEVVRRHSVEAFSEAEWSVIGQITIHRLCWDSIKERFSAVVPSIFQVLADAGFDEWLKYWESIK